MKRNEIKLYTPITVDGRTMVPGNFNLKEFENKNGFVMVHPSVLVSLELTRHALQEMTGSECSIIITCGTRTEAENEALGKRYGWIDEGGTVSRVSRHLSQCGGIAVDMKAVYTKNKRKVSQRKLGEAARRYFDYVKDDYADGHVHADNRSQKP